MAVCMQLTAATLLH